MEMDDDDDDGGGGGGPDLALLSLAPFSLPSPFEDVYVYVTGQTAAALPATSVRVVGWWWWWSSFSHFSLLSDPGAGRTEKLSARRR